VIGCFTDLLLLHRAELVAERPTEPGGAVLRQLLDAVARWTANNPRPLKDSADRTLDDVLEDALQNVNHPEIKLEAVLATVSDPQRSRVERDVEAAVVEAELVTAVQASVLTRTDLERGNKKDQGEAPGPHLNIDVVALHAAFAQGDGYAAMKLVWPGTQASAPRRARLLLHWASVRAVVDDVPEGRERLRENARAALPVLQERLRVDGGTSGLWARAVLGPGDGHS
jgi:hypothetical protein